ncbi:SanA/YdcF family protein [Luteococcus peritonei]|uniref:Vancomycin high temperature exclusion protein n=1 Tax=Luteococcus peritonei TaxID=88874 RepID=A0ABW4RSI0_9ACTN
MTLPRPSSARLLGTTLLAGAGATVLLVGGLGAGVQLLTRGRILDADALAALPRPPRVALVLGAEVLSDGRPSRYLRARLDLAATLHRRGLVDVLLVSGDNGEKHYNEPEGMRRHLEQAGIPPEDIVADHAGFDTYDSCLRARDIFGVERLVVVSQSYHLPRALATCRLLGMEAWGVGDESVRRVPGRWRRYVAREQLANVKMLLDITSRRPATAGPRETSVDQALARPRD